MLSRVMSGVVHQKHIHLAVIVIVVIGEINLAVQLLGGFCNCIRRFIGTIIGHVPGKCHGAIYVKYGFKSTVGVIIIKIPYRTSCPI